MAISLFTTNTTGTKNHVARGTAPQITREFTNYLKLQQTHKKITNYTVKKNILLQTFGTPVDSRKQRILLDKFSIIRNYIDFHLCTLKHFPHILLHTWGSHALWVRTSNITSNRPVKND